MRRRSLLASVAALAATTGCSSLSRTRIDEQSESGGTTTSSTSDAPPATTTGDDPPSQPDDPQLVVALETGARTVALPRFAVADEVNVTLSFARTATAETPAVVNAWLATPGDATATVDPASLAPFDPDGLTHEDGDARIALVPAAPSPFASGTPAVEPGPDGFWRLARGDDWLVDDLKVPGEGDVYGRFHLVEDADSSGFPTGEYGSGRLTVWNTDRPGPDGDSQFAGVDVPSLHDGNTDWYHDADADARTFVRPATESTALPAELSFEFVNRTRQTLGCGGWSLYKFHDGNWHDIAPWIVLTVCRRLPPGGTDTWTIHAASDGTADAGEERRVIDGGYLGGGQYAFEARYSSEEHDRTDAVLFELDAPSVTVAPTETAASTRDGDIVTVTEPAWNDNEHPPNAELVATRIDTGKRPLLPEECYRLPYRPLRNVVPFFEPGVERVVLRTDEHTAERVLPENRPSQLDFQGTAFDLSVERSAE